MICQMMDLNRQPPMTELILLFSELIRQLAKWWLGRLGGDLPAK